MSVRLFKSLLYKSTRIQTEIEREQSHRWPNAMRLLKLKKLRLAIKDRLQRLIRDGVAASRRTARARNTPRHPQTI